jgi:hypothetical protein
MRLEGCRQGNGSFTAKFVMPGHSCPKDGVASLAYVPGIHILAALVRKTWMAGTSPAMTKKCALQEAVCFARRTRQIAAYHNK